MKTALVTGGGRGIGASICERLAREGYRVYINYNESETAAGKLADRLLAEGLDAEAIRADVTDAEAVRRMMGTILAKSGRIDLVVNNAGVSHYGMIQDVTDEEWDRVFDINVKGTFHVCREAARMGSRVGVLATLATTLEPTKNTISRTAREMGRHVELVDGLVDAFNLDQEQFRALLVGAAEKMADQVDVIVLAQGSMAYVEQDIEKAVGKPTLSSPRFGAIELKKALQAKGLMA